MRKIQISRKSPNILYELGFSPEAIDFWNQLQREHHAEDLTLIEYALKDDSDAYWRCYRAVTNIGKASKENTQVYSRLNTYLKACFVQSNFGNTAEFWETLQQQLHWGGFFMPVEDLQRLDRNQILEEVAFLKLLKRDFPYIAYLTTVKTLSVEEAHQNQPLPIIAIWQFFRYYIDFLKELSLQKSEIFYTLQGWYAHRLKPIHFKQLLPSEQLVTLLYITGEQFFWKNIYQINRTELLELACPAVQAFFADCTNQLTILFESGFNTQVLSMSGNLEQTVRQQYYEVCQLDMKYIQVQEVLDDDSEKHFKNNFPQLVSYLTVQEERAPTIKDRLKRMIGTVSEIIKGDSNTRPQPSYLSPRIPFAQKDSLKWYDLSDAVFEEITQAIKAQMPKKLGAVAQTRWQQYLQNIGNAITMPVLIWEQDKKGIFPQWNIFNLSQTIAFQKTLTKKFESRNAERKRLKALLEELYNLTLTYDIDRLYRTTPPFGYQRLQKEWKQTVQAYRAMIESRNIFRIRRMREFGILVGDETINDRKNLWLDEMLKIEEEVRPYILYVKKAFQSALPVRRSVEFHPYRHNHDGVEFDPMTIQDQDKWLRARVMKTLRHKVVHGEVEQVNTFCLDFSGSMDHDRMRNLFKVVFLLILGLEDRKSYDAVHFFSTEFIETSNFSSDYTNRSLLFKILKKIAVFKDRKPVYGGMGGTNISDGVTHCHQRTLDFMQEIHAKNTAINITASIFVITDGEPSLGIFKPAMLHDFIDAKRQEGNVAIKGIYIKPEEDNSTFMAEIFGQGNYVETTDFKEAVDRLVAIMTRTYREQRKDFKWLQKQRKINQYSRD